MIIQMAESGWLPDPLVRFGIRRLLGRRLQQEQQRKPEALTEALRAAPVAVDQDAANEQHYEVDARFYEKVLGPHLKYSSGYWPAENSTLAEAEAAMLALTCERAELANGQNILEMGCGWGSLTLWMAEHYPDSQVTAISNSSTQREFILGRANEKGLTNVRVITADAASFTPDQQFDRVVSVEMFEHMRNHRTLMARIHDWLVPGGKLFVHVFCHRELTYLFEDKGDSDWMARNFFSGGMMPSWNWLPECAEKFNEEQRWAVNGTHYGRTLEAWLVLADTHQQTLIPLLDELYGAGEGKRWLQRWRMFFMACAELFNYGDGNEWFVAHYRFARP
ncbi:MAG: SAM-dependent methyltransferase [Alcanivorax sediminis]|uniref:Methyltransferase domain-containing protein n=1 Tax=Alcanivorax sediminis TaxID=2663008 RepID=A0A6N7LT09_9GAMM|nr:class I SAM-dependent methyltransferase [Alcanivorax sediminis]MQX53382.1 methyltransferase domain-containing protein [Alcanivorax sediminis]